MENLGQAKHEDVQGAVMIAMQEAERLAALDRSRKLLLNVLKFIVICNWAASRTDDDSVVYR